MKGEHGFCLSNGKRQVLTISQIVWTGLIRYAHYYSPLFNASSIFDL